MKGRGSGIPSLALYLFMRLRIKCLLGILPGKTTAVLTPYGRDACESLCCATGPLGARTETSRKSPRLTAYKEAAGADDVFAREPGVYVTEPDIHPGWLARCSHVKNSFFNMANNVANVSPVSRISTSAIRYCLYLVLQSSLTRVVRHVREKRGITSDYFNGILTSMRESPCRHLAPPQDANDLEPSQRVVKTATDFYQKFSDRTTGKRWGGVQIEPLEQVQEHVRSGAYQAILAQIAPPLVTRRLPQV